MVAVVEVSRGNGHAVDGAGLYRCQFAQTGATGMARNEAEDWGQVTARKAQVAAGNGADQETAVADLVDGRPSVGGAHLEMHHRQRVYLFHTDYPRGVGETVRSTVRREL